MSDPKYSKRIFQNLHIGLHTHVYLVQGTSHTVSHHYAIYTKLNYCWRRSTFTTTILLYTVYLQMVTTLTHLETVLAPLAHFKLFYSVSPAGACHENLLNFGTQTAWELYGLKAGRLVLFRYHVSTFACKCRKIGNPFTSKRFCGRAASISSIYRRHWEGNYLKRGYKIKDGLHFGNYGTDCRSQAATHLRSAKEQ